MRTALAIGIGAAAAGGTALYLTRNRPQVKHAANAAKGAVHGVKPHLGRDEADDATLADRVRSEIFRDDDAPKGDVSVDVQAGVAYLRGAVADEAWIERLGKDAGNVPGITGVKNLLHTPGTPTPAAEPRSVAAEQHKH
jgi:BON domain